MQFDALFFWFEYYRERVIFFGDIEFSSEKKKKKFF